VAASGPGNGGQARPPSEPNHCGRRAAAWLLAVTLVVTLPVRAGVLLVPGAFQTDPDGYRVLAWNLLEHGTLGRGAIPTAYRPPLYPLLLTPALALGPLERAGIGILHLALGLATVGITYRLAGRWGLGRRGALAAALLAACDPLLLAGSALVMTETLAALLAVASLACLTAASERPSPRRAAAAGAAMALAVLCRPTFLPWTFLAAIFLPWLAARTRAATPVRAALGVAASFAAAAALVLAPWALRNQLQFGRPIVTTTHGGYTLLLGNNPYFYEHLRSAPWGSVWLADKLQDDLARRAPRNTPAGELAADRAAYDLAWETIRGEPATFAYSCAVRVGRLWSPLPHQLSPDEGLRNRSARYGVGLWYAMELPLALLGLAVLWRGASRWKEADQADSTGENGETSQEAFAPPVPDRPRWQAARRAGAGVMSGRIGALWIAILAASVTAVHTVYWADMRMRTPLMPALALAASAGLGWVVSLSRRRK